MVSYEATLRKYRGRTAEGYVAKRQTQERWRRENDIISEWVRALPRGSTMLDVPVGTGRFLRLYDECGLIVTGVDASDEMLALARPLAGLTTKLQRGDATQLPHDNLSFDAAVCVRFLDLIPEDTMTQVMKELARVTRSRIMLTVRLGERYEPKSNTATHGAILFARTIRRLGWRQIDVRPIFQAGWFVMLLERRENDR